MADNSAEWEREWRQGIEGRLKETAEANKRAAEANQETAVILERVNGRLEEHDRRIAALEARPAQSANEARLWFTTANSGLGTLIAIAAVLISLLIGLLPHLTFH